MSDNRYNHRPVFLLSTSHATHPAFGELQQLANTIAPTEPRPGPSGPLGAAYDAAREQTTAKDRAIATTLRIVLWVLTVFLATGRLYLLEVALTPLVATAGLLLLLGFRWLTRLDYEYSAPGIARCAIDAAERLAAEQMAHNDTLRKAALDAFLRHREAHDDPPIGRLPHG